MTEILSARACVPCRKDTKALDAAQIAALSADVPAWSVLDDGKRIARTYKFKDFAGAFGFVSRIADLAEAEDHHPDISFGWGYVSLSFQTHSIGGLHDNDFILAARSDRASEGSDV